MSTILWDTNGTEIVKTLSAERRAAGALASGLALTLVVVTEEEYAEEAQAAATTAASAHPCRLLVVVRRRVDADDRLDAEVQVGGRLGANEAVMMRMYGRLSLHAESVVLPLLASDAPVVTWWHGSTPDRLAWDALGVLAGRRVTDAVFSGDDPIAALRRRAKDYAPGDTDLAWTRATPWRALLASAFDDMTARPTSAEVQAEHANPSAALLAGWLTSRLGIKVRRSDSGGPGVTAVDVRFEGKERLRIDRPDGYLATLSRTGISDRQLPLKRRGLGELLAEELRRLDADEVYAEALSVVTGAEDLADRPPMRTLIWRDPEKRVTRKATPAPKTSRSAAAAKAGASPGDAAVKKATKRKAAQSGKAASGTSKRTATKVAARRASKKKS